MDAWVWWIIAACVLGAGEALTTSFFLAPFALGAAFAALASALGAPAGADVVVCLAVGALVLVGLRPVVRRHVHVPLAIRTGPAALVGHTAVVVERIDNDQAKGLARIDGELWSARAYFADRVLEPGQRVEVVEIRGATALVD